ncbi:MAG: ABC transporter ATP-binding protein [Hyphomicrobiales bacterium]
MLSTYKRIWGLLSRRERRQVAFLLVLILAAAFAQMVGVASVMPFMSLAANPEAITTNSYLATGYAFLQFTSVRQYMLFLGIAVFAVLIVSILIKALSFYAVARFTEMRTYSLSKRLMASYLHQPYDWFLNRHSADLGKSILSETEQVIKGALAPSLFLISDGAVVVAIAILLILVDPFLATAVAVLFGGAYGMIYLYLRKYLSRMGAERLDANHRRFEAVQETFGSIKDVKVGGLEGILLKRYDVPARQFARTRAVEVTANQMPRFALEALAFGGLLAVVLYLLADRGGLQDALPVLGVYAFAAYRLMPALQNVYGYLVALRFNGPALESLSRELASWAPATGLSLPVGRAQPLGLTKSLSLEAVTYAYPGGERLAIRELTLEIPANTTVGLVGRTGSGKTTTVDIILGLLRPQAGCVRVDGVPIVANNLREWQATIGYVPQYIYLVDATVTANIAFGVPPEEVDKLAVERAARAANIHDFVVEELPSGYETTVGERGVRLSGGQRQRIGIARALYHEPDLLVLDEATSALDNVTEQAVMDAVHNLGSRKTIIMIAHRLSTVRDCDTVVLLANGMVVNRGSFNELVCQSDIFREMAITSPVL